MRLSHDQVSFFRRNGYFKIPRVLSNKAVAALKAASWDHARRKVHPFQTHNGDLVRLDQVVQRGGVFRAAALAPPLLGALEGLLGPNIELTLNRHNHVTFNTAESTTFRLHRDVLQWSRGMVTVIVYLEDSTLENGCTHMIPGSQQLPFIGVPNNGGTWMDEHEEFTGLLGQALPIPMPAGGALLLDSLAFHSVGTNKGPGTRMSLTLGFHSQDELSGSSPDPKKLLVRGSYLYKGNDKR
ncbi:phytanoyl-CoA dioxygenase family protein [Candidatus Gottesmanbacteria bacterium]|nr:phytanoyl-CoA dioxygenase family protein [Candidatus Gottesmanbacteria bacterium]